MRVAIDGGGVRIHEAGDLTRLSVEAPAVPDAVRDGGEIGVRAADVDQHVWLDVGPLRTLAGVGAAPGWQDEFAAMVGFAARHGWTSPDGRSLMAHLSAPTSASSTDERTMT